MPDQRFQQQKKHILILGCGYVGTHLAQACLNKKILVSASTRNPNHAEELKAQGIAAFVCQSPEELPKDVLQQITHLVDSIPLTHNDDGMFASQGNFLPTLTPQLKALQWAGYLSTTGVYGDAKGAWVNEDSLCQPQSERGRARLLAEQVWLNSGLPAEVFRLAGIYGQKRNIIPRLMAGQYKAVAWQPEHYSSRIHVDDIVQTLMAAMDAPRAGRILNVADDLPLPHSQYVQQVASMIGAPEPIILSAEEGQAQLSATALSFFSDNKRISNQRLHDELLDTLKFPNFQSGIAHILQYSRAHSAKETT